MRENARFVYLILALVLLAALIIVVLGWRDGGWFRSPVALYRRAQDARPERAARLYGRLGAEWPQIAEYAELWAAEAQMPSVEAVAALHAVVDFRPQSPAAYRAQVILARYYAAQEAPQAEEAYRAALALRDAVPLRLELARYLERRGAFDAAYAEYRRLLGPRADAFDPMRRVGPDPLTVARDLNAAYYHSDALETLRGVDDPAALLPRAEALAGLGRYAEAEAAYRAWLDETPDDAEAQMGLADALASQGEVEEAEELYAELDTFDSRLAQADLLAEEDPERALELYLDSPYPVAWWTATGILEREGEDDEALDLYARVAQSDAYFADDAAFRMYVLARRRGDDARRAEAEALLEALGPNELALRALDEELQLPLEPPWPAVGEEILEKVGALEALGEDELARMELTLAAQFRAAPALDLTMAQALAERGHVVEAYDIATAYLADHRRAPRVMWELSYPRPYSDTVRAAAEAFEVDPLLIWAVMRQESRYDPEAVSYVGARGLMQVMPSTQTWIGEQWGETLSPGVAFDPAVNIRMGAWFLSFLLDYFDGDLDLVIAAYNGGAASVERWLEDPQVADRADWLRWIGFGQTREYVQIVSLNYRVYRYLYQESEVAP
jgi:soluble lytic murein transglycosylase